MDVYTLVFVASRSTLVLHVPVISSTLFTSFNVARARRKTLEDEIKAELVRTCVTIILHIPYKYQHVCEIVV